jgi:hypothetical protein
LPLHGLGEVPLRLPTVVSENEVTCRLDFSGALRDAPASSPPLGQCSSKALLFNVIYPPKLQKAKRY